MEVWSTWWVDVLQLFSSRRLKAKHPLQLCWVDLKLVESAIAVWQPSSPLFRNQWVQSVRLYSVYGWNLFECNKHAHTHGVYDIIDHIWLLSSFMELWFCCTIFNFLYYSTENLLLCDRFKIIMYGAVCCSSCVLSIFTGYPRCWIVYMEEGRLKKKKSLQAILHKVMRCSAYFLAARGGENVSAHFVIPAVVIKELSAAFDVLINCHISNSVQIRKCTTVCSWSHAPLRVRQMTNLILFHPSFCTRICKKSPV